MDCGLRRKVRTRKMVFIQRYPIVGAYKTILNTDFRSP